MLRLVLLMCFLAVLGMACLALMGGLRVFGGETVQKEEAPMSAVVRRIAYGVLIILMTGVAAGWLGAA